MQVLKYPLSAVSRLSVNPEASEDRFKGFKIPVVIIADGSRVPHREDRVFADGTAIGAFNSKSVLVPEGVDEPEALNS